MRSLTALLMLALLAAPVALAQDEKTDNETRPDDAAWVDDCPPDMMCAYGSEDCIECSGPSDEPVPYGNESCIECSGPGRVGPDDCIDCFQAPSETCMDGAQENETCRDDVQYIGGPTRGPSDGSCENCRGEEAPAQAETESDAAAEKAVPIPAAVVIIALAAALVFVAMRR